MNLETISVFIQKLVNLAGLCSFDDEFHALYRHNQDLLLALNKNQWIDIYARRRDIINQYHRQWTVELLPLNLLWFELGRLVASDFHIPILDLMCPNEPIYQKDREYVEQHDYFILDLFKDDKGYLRSFNYYFLMLMKGQGDVYGHLYKMSLLEAEQNKNKRRWSTLCREEMSYIWEDPTAENLFKDSAYPLFDCIKTYFTSPLSELSQGQIRTLILALYSNELIYLDRITVNAFYAQKLRIDNEIELRMIEVLLICMEERPAISLLPYMLAIAHWVAKFNPSMVIGVHELDTRFNDCPDVLDDIYRVHRIGPYWRERIPKEVHGLSQFIDANKLMSGIKEKLLRLSDLLSAPPAESNDRMIFDQMQIINLDFDNFNGINRPVVYNGLGYKISKDFVYDRDGINEQLILINQILSGAGFLSRYGIQCYYRYMMRFH